MRLILSFLLLVFLQLCCFRTYGQISYAKKIVKELSSKKMYGRGYVKKGDLKAARYIKKEFKEIGLLAFDDNYFQNFDFDVNTHPKKLVLKLNDTVELIPGVDYIVDPSSPSLKGEFRVLRFTVSDLLNSERMIQKLPKAKDKIILIDLFTISEFSKNEKSIIYNNINYIKYSSEHPAKAVVVFSKDKLTWSGSTVQMPRVNFTCNKKIDLNSINNVTTHINSVFHKNYTSQNIIGYIKGSSKKDSLIVLTAHYDHLGMMGNKTYFPGANDNASGIAMLLNQAKYFSQKENKPKYDMVFIAFGGEEIGLLGSKYFTENPLFPLSKITFLLNFDLAGTGEEGIKVVNATEFVTEFQLLKKLNEQFNLLEKVAPRGTACNSDHCFFYKQEVPCFYIYTLGGIKAYHDIYDKYETLPLTKLENYSKLIQLFVKNLYTKK